MSFHFEIYLMLHETRILNPCSAVHSYFLTFDFKLNYESSKVFQINVIIFGFMQFFLTVYTYGMDM